MSHFLLDIAPYFTPFMMNLNICNQIYKLGYRCTIIFNICLISSKKVLIIVENMKIVHKNVDSAIFGGPQSTRIKDNNSTGRKASKSLKKLYRPVFLIQYCERTKQYFLIQFLAFIVEKGWLLFC